MSTSQLRSNTVPEPPERTPQQWFYYIRDIILNTIESKDLSFSEIPPLTGALPARLFCEDPQIERKRPRIQYNSVTQNLTARVMPTKLHDCHQIWMRNEMDLMKSSRFLTLPEYRFLKPLVGTRFDEFVGNYVNSSKEPDFCIMPDNRDLPTLVIESDWSETFPRLRNDMRLWLDGGGGAVNVVILIRWTRLTGDRIQGVLEVYRYIAGGAVMTQEESIFPRSVGNTNQTIPITRGELFGAFLFPGRSADLVYHLDIDNLRSEVIPMIQSLGCMPA